MNYRAPSRYLRNLFVGAGGWLAALIFCGCGLQFGLGGDMTERQGVVIAETQLPDGDLRSGDLLLSWRLAGTALAQTEFLINTPFDLWFMAEAYKVMGEVALEVQRNNTAVTIRITQPYDWQGLARPRLSPADEQTLSRAQTLWAENQQEKARRLLATLAEALERKGEASSACWVWLTQLAVGPTTTAHQAARQSAQSAGRGIQAWVEDSLGNALLKQGRFASAREAHKRALQLRSDLGAHDLLRARSLGRLAVASYQLADLTEASRWWQEAKSILSPLTRANMALAKIDTNLGLCAHKSGHLAEARKLLLTSLSLKQRLAPESISLANTLCNLGETERMLGNLKNSEKYALQALAIYRPRGDVHGQVEVLNQLGNVQHDRHNYPEAKTYYTEALALHARRDSPTAMTLYNCLGTITEELGELEQAHEFYEKAIGLARGLYPESIALVRYLSNQAGLEIKRRDPEQALVLLANAHLILEKTPQQGLEARCLTVEADALRSLGQHAAAAEKLKRAIVIRRRLTPDGYALARLLLRLGIHCREQDQWEQALVHLKDGVAVLERQLLELGGGNMAEMTFLDAFPDNYKALVETHVLMGNPEEAFACYERYRGRALLGMLLTRDLNLFADHPQLADRWQRVIADLAEDYGQLKKLDKQDPAIDILRAKIAEGHREVGRFQDELAGLSSGLASLRYPEPMTGTSISASLDPGTLLLTYCVGEKQSTLFALLAGEQGAPRVFTLDVGEKMLSNRIKHLRKAINKGPDRAPQHHKRLYAEAAYLYEKLLGPVEDLVGSADRVLIVPDGPLNQLPFATLVRYPEGGDQPQYLISWKPLHTAVSATVYSRLLHDRPAAGEALLPERLIAFANPSHPGWPDLPRAADEGKRIVAQYGGDSQLFLGRQATEKRLASLGEAPAMLHFATHGHLDDRFPLESALMLTPTDGEDGRLQVWEILERYRLKSTLVVLSGCQTGLGENMGGNGLLGLTLAFQATGARSVLASLWRVSDASTAILMDRFYTNLRKGLSKDDAFRFAQLDFIAGRGVKPAFSDPFHWGAFTLFGDFK